MNIYSVINMDIVGSRKLFNRERIQEEIIRYFDILNFKYKDILVAPINITLGDEWQIVLNSPEKSYSIYNEIRLYLAKKSIITYCGIGIGSISTAEYNSSTKMDGEAFISAREALNITKNKRNKYIHSKANRVIIRTSQSLYTFMESVSEIAVTNYSSVPTKESISSIDIINILIENNEILFNNITDKQLEAIELYEKYGSYNKIIEAKEANSKSSISQRLNKAEYFVFKNNAKAIGELINKLLT
ncbi:SatD family protein [Clostridium paraputrificum]|uniref:SatD family protein n=1 Tax=Clostridium TaxID=1485 RepID=UPI003D33FF84